MLILACIHCLCSVETAVVLALLTQSAESVVLVNAFLTLTIQFSHDILAAPQQKMAGYQLIYWIFSIDPSADPSKKLDTFWQIGHVWPNHEQSSDLVLFCVSFGTEMEFQQIQCKNNNNNKNSSMLFRSS